MNDEIQELTDQVFTKKDSKDIIKGVAFDRGQVFLGSESKYKTLVAMIILSDAPITSADNSEIILAGGCNDMSNQIMRLEHFKPEYPLGTLSSAIVEVSNMDLESRERIKKSERSNRKHQNNLAS